MTGLSHSRLFSTAIVICRIRYTYVMSQVSWHYISGLDAITGVPTTQAVSPRR
jgi:hypothetical protein